MGGEAPQPFGRVSGAPGAAQTPTMPDPPPKLQPRLPQWFIGGGEFKIQNCHEMAL